MPRTHHAGKQGDWGDETGQDPGSDVEQSLKNERMLAEDVGDHKEHESYYHVF